MDVISCEQRLHRGAQCGDGGGEGKERVDAGGFLLVCVFMLQHCVVKNTLTDVGFRL